MKKNVARRPRFKRVSDFLNMRLTDRDRAILAAVSRFRFLTTSHIISLTSGSRQNIIRRLQRLYHTGFLDRPRAQLPLRFAGELAELVYAPTRNGVVQTAVPGGAAVWKKTYRPVTSLFLKHALSVSDALISIEVACRLCGVNFVPEQNIFDSTKNIKAERLQWRITIKSGRFVEKVGIIPDAVFAVERKDESGIQRRWYFLEADRGTMPLYRRSLRLSSIRRKALAYSQSRRSKTLKERFGIPGFQVLFVSRSKGRLERMKNVCSEATQGRDTSLFLFVSIDDLKHDETLASLGMV
jgi:hypothetical protein